MVKVEFKQHQVWHELAEILDNIDVNALLTQHLEACDYKISGYWDEEEEFYEEIILPRHLDSQLVSSSIGITDNWRWIKLNFVLKADKPDSEINCAFGNLTLIYDDNLQFIDENWQININSPLVVAKREQ